MTAFERVSSAGRDGADAHGPCMRGRAPAKPVSSSPLSPKGKSLSLVTVEDLVNWAYGRELVHRARRPGFAGLLAGGPRSGGFDSSAQLGAGVNSSMNLGFEAPGDAYVVERLVEALPPAMKREVRDYAISGTRPDWIEDPMIVCHRGPAIYGVNERRRRTLIGYAVSFHGDLPEHVAMMRGKYAAWWDGLLLVRDALRDSPELLTDHAMDDRLPPQKPWALR